MSVTIERILCPVDFSEHGIRALRYAVALAAPRAAAIRLLHVVEVPDALFADFDGEVIPPVLLRQFQDEASRSLEQTAESLRRSHENVSHCLAVGRPFAEIVQVARDWQADLIVMPTHGRTGLEHVLIGSVAEKVVRKSPCPVLTVPGDRGHD